jgi:hypothetical protein
MRRTRSVDESVCVRATRVYAAGTINRRRRLIELAVTAVLVAVVVAGEGGETLWGLSLWVIQSDQVEGWGTHVTTPEVGLPGPGSDTM